MSGEMGVISLFLSNFSLPAGDKGGVRGQSPLI